MLVPTAALSVLLPLEVVPTQADRARVLAGAAAFIRAEVGLAPAHVRTGVTVLSVAFAGWVWLGSLGTGSPVSAVTAWERVAGSPGRSLTRLLRSLGVLWLLEDDVVLRSLGIPPLRDRNEAARERRRHLTAGRAA